MNQLKTAAIAAIFLVPILGLASCTAKSQLPSPAIYLSGALANIQSQAWNSDKVDWTTVRTKCMNLTANAKTPADTYAAINFALESLKDNHSFLERPDGSRYKAESEASSGSTDDSFLRRNTGPLIEQ